MIENIGPDVSTAWTHLGDISKKPRFLHTFPAYVHAVDTSRRAAGKR
jgi:hypothetical protein